MTSVSTLTNKIKSLAETISKGTRRLTADRIACGKLLIELRSRFGVANTKGGFRGSHRGEFTSHLESNGINVGSAYNWIALAEGKTQPSTKVRHVLSKYVSRLNKAESQEEKKAALAAIVAYLTKRYKIA